MSDVSLPGLLEITSTEGVTVVRFLHRSLLDPLAIEAASDALTVALHADPPRLLLDFGSVESVASAMVGRLVALHQQVAAVGGVLGFCSVGPFLSRIFSLCHLPASIITYPDSPSGVAAMSSGSATGSV